VKFLIDNALSPFVAAQLRLHHHDAVHVRDIGLHSAEDRVVLEQSSAQGRTVIVLEESRIRIRRLPIGESG
jgi:predicted nuclease of predicted toxin-antitoxin system